VHREQNFITFVVVDTKESAVKVSLVFEMLTDVCVALFRRSGFVSEEKFLDCVELVCDIENLKFLSRKKVKIKIVI
jgi:hypothetical protein